MLQSSVQSMQTKTKNTTVKDTKAELKLIAENATLKEENKSLKKQVKELQATLLAKESKFEKVLEWVKKKLSAVLFTKSQREEEKKTSQI